MWICFNDGFISAVEDKGDRSRLMVRARRREHLETIVPGRKIIVTPDRDYRYRVLISKDDYADAVAARVRGIDYGNFKNSVGDGDLHDVYARFWSLHHRMQQ
jgi:hypothetical protein